MKIRTIVDSRIRIPLADLERDPKPEQLERALVKVCEHSNPTYHRLRAMGKHWTKEPPIIRTWTKDEEHLSFPRGTSRALRKVFEEFGHSRELIDQRTDGEPDLAGAIPAHRVELRGYQEQAVRALKAGQNCILRAPTGCGKTTIAIALAARINLPTMIIVNTAGLHRQWVERAVAELGIRKEDVGIVQGSKFKLRPLTIGMQKTLCNVFTEGGVRAAELGSTFGVVICDEVQRFAAPTFIGAIDGFSSRWRIGISADERRKDRKEFLLRDEFGRVELEINRGDLIKLGAVLDVEVIVVPTELRVSERIDPKQDLDALYAEMARDVDRNALIFKLVEEVSNEPLLIFSHRREHCMSLDSALISMGEKSGTMIGGDDFRVEFEKTKKLLRAGKLRIGIGTVQSIGTGIDIPAVGTGIVTMPIAANKQLVGQVRGRLCRPHGGRKVGRLFYLWDQHVFGETPLVNLIRWNNAVRVREGDREVDANAYLRRWREEQARKDRDSFV